MTNAVNNCPRCGGDEFAHGYSWPPMEGSVECYADGCEVIAIGATEAEAIALWNGGGWNYRVASYDENGHRQVVADSPPGPAARDPGEE